jgi:hypothetical protein
VCGACGVRIAARVPGGEIYLKGYQVALAPDGRAVARLAKAPSKMLDKRRLENSWPSTVPARKLDERFRAPFAGMPPDSPDQPLHRKAERGLIDGLLLVCPRCQQVQRLHSDCWAAPCPEEPKPLASFVVPSA